MRRLMMAVMLGVLAAGPLAAQEPLVPAPQEDPCEVPGYLLFGDAALDEVAKAVRERERLKSLSLEPAHRLSSVGSNPIPPGWRRP